jgi:uncharacterized protein (DUF1810 family)
VSDPYDLDRFVEAQAGGTYERAHAELMHGRKTSHWMWFIFPQVAGLGHSEMTVRYAISGLAEARAYWQHPALGRRYDECVQALLSLDEVAITDVLGPVDALKLHSSLTLFAQAAPQAVSIDQLLTRHFGGEPDRETLRVLGDG